MSKKKQPQKVNKPKAAPAVKAKRFWAKRLYIPGFGFVDLGDEASQEALIAWAAKSKVDVNDYLKEE
jgi:hypothetical protein